MVDTKRVFFLVLIQVATAVFVAGVALWLLYQTAISREKANLGRIVQSQAYLIRAIVADELKSQNINPQMQYSPLAIRIGKALEEFHGLGETGEFMMGRKEEDRIHFLLRARHLKGRHPDPVPFNGNLATPMQEALAGKSGQFIGVDYRGATVVAAYTPIAQLGWGLVAKQDLEELKRPFLATFGMVTLGGVGIISVGTALFLWLTTPMIRRMERSERRYRSLFTNANDGILIIDPATGLLLDANAVASARLGYTREELIGMGIADIGEAQSFAANRHRLREVREKGESVFEHIHLCKDGSLMQVEINARLVTLEDGPVVQAHVRDISERKRISLELEQKTLYLDNILRTSVNLSIIATDLDFTIRYFNPTAETIFGYKAEQVIGHQVMEIHTWEGVSDERFERGLVAAKKNGEHIYTVHQPPEKGGIIVESRVSTILDREGRQVGWMLMSRDVTGREKAAAELRAHRDHLDEMVRERTRELAESRAQYQDLS